MNNAQIMNESDGQIAENVTRTDGLLCNEMQANWFIVLVNLSSEVGSNRLVFIIYFLLLMLKLFLTALIQHFLNSISQ